MLDLYSDSYDNASPDFLTDLFLYGEDKVTTKFMHKNGSLDVLCGNHNRPRFTILTCKRETRSYPKDGWNGMHFTVLVMQLMDGSNTMIKDVTDTCLSSFVEARAIKLVPGSTIIVPDFRIVRMTDNFAGFCANRMIMLIKDFGWIYPPQVDMPYVSARDQLRPISQVFSEVHEFKQKERKICFILRKTADKNSHQACLLFMVSRKDMSDGRTVFVQVDEESFARGDWIQDFKTKFDWVKKFAVKKKKPIANVWEDSEEEEDECQCKKKFIYTECIAKQYPHESVDKDQIIETFSPFCEAPHKLDGNMEWDEVKDATQRWCLYKHYHSNFFRNSEGNCQPLSWCVEKYIKKACFPADGKFTGFKSSKKRAAERITGKKGNKITMVESKKKNKAAVASTGKENESASDSDSSEGY
ncbi:hypothetical protein SEMRO_762_G198610.1 [Seminavis robusta]|uniref:Uncharacterized protein n=1 Tax=Seminavis robusta TaxID=568900 RepID=A0A9N8HKJ9_9STRA|nr:hypothetical protein SEMRO_762_G198610.1 [Seminavis robusta]|eukprot:Sro762_g198610.1 n/a (414) ;mRNA; r:1422-2663